MAIVKPGVYRDFLLQSVSVTTVISVFNLQALCEQKLPIIFEVKHTESIRSWLQFWITSNKIGSQKVSEPKKLLTDTVLQTLIKNTA